MNHPSADRPSPAKVTYNAFGLPVSTEFDDIYFSNENGLAESHYVFIQHNDLEKRWQTHSYTTFTIAETGFGTGLNFLACWAAFQKHAPPQLRLHFISFEKHPLTAADLELALNHFPELADEAAALLHAYPAPHYGCHRMQFCQGLVVLDLWFGDIHQQLPQWLPHAQQTVDAWFLDGFAPDKNPQMWQPTIYTAMAESCRNNATFATFTAAGAVRRDLQAAGFTVNKAKGFRHKREMLYGHRLAPNKATQATDKHVTIIGGGIAAACTAWSLSRRGYRVELFTTGIADGASGNAQGAVYPLLHAELSPLTQFFLSAFDHARQFYQQVAPAQWHETGVVQLAFNSAREQRHEKIIAADIYSPATVQGLSPDDTQQLWSHLPAMPSLYYPKAGWVPPQQLVEQILAACADKVTLTVIDPITDIQAHADGWQLNTTAGQQLHATTLIVAAGAGLEKLLKPWQMTFQNVRGQVTQVKANDVSEQCPVVVCYKGYFTPAREGTHCVGATYAREFDIEQFSQPTAQDTAENLATLQDNLDSNWTEQLEPVADRASLRNTTRDHLPACGWLTPSLGVLGGLGSRGFTSAPLCAELLVGQWLQEPLPISAELINRLAPQRLQADRA
ncbi:bifunctional tRNA (5-methylaminomethyl-2-thiouridine)(34)-methyltransferase MnmD/FAD-dependent 5-carboxymethylaminomethyl-2-thiouridine(34) oxidoreductase MnmC [Pseudidiomarina sp.]|uniref:bifunctional tRNA (5-methylaminomethyl-2-thiouridine)(34)-methyltransferase MnmD/FAD-dependent 5-carboxymethylaminomethyl-2-thiouridine(34) oxidoreductase MnmC n=1 Tax=Pseudidiomarina sp. TaxID=2081707 RepID=UPI003A9769CE